MKQFFYYKCVRKTIIEFLNIFNDIRIAKYDSGGNVVKYINVPIKLAPKEKFYSWLYDRTGEKRYPMMSAEIVGIEHSRERLTGKHEENIADIENDDIPFYFTPSPYDINFELRIGTEYVNEADQIIEQILPYFNPFVYTKLRIPEINKNFNIKIIFEGLTIDNPPDIDEEDYRRLVWTLTFRAQTFLLQPIGDIKEIQKIVHKFYTTDETWAYRNSDTEAISGIGHDAEELLVSGRIDEDENEIIKYEVW